MLNPISIFTKKLLIPLSKCKFCGILFDNLPQKSACGGQADEGAKRIDLFSSAIFYWLHFTIRLSAYSVYLECSEYQ